MSNYENGLREISPGSKDDATTAIGMYLQLISENICTALFKISLTLLQPIAHEYARVSEINDSFVFCHSVLSTNENI